jgi:DNA-binding response OmpR family regulator
MRRKILIAEQADTVRSIAETVLRQNGYDVIAVTAAEKAREVLELSRPDLIIVGADLMAPDGIPYYEKLRVDPRSGDIPMLLFQPADKSDLPFPNEVIIPRPFDPRDLLNQVSVFLGARDAVVSLPEGTPSFSEVNDDFLDAALGLDDIKITESEVMNQTVAGRRPQGAQSDEKLIGLEGRSNTNDSGRTSVNVESLVLDEASGRAVHQVPGRKAPSKEGTGKIDILTDQYGLTAPHAAGQDENISHDYNWFVDAIRKDNDPAVGGAPRPHDSGRLTLAPSSETVDPITRGPKPPISPNRSSDSSGVEKFIDEFKKEMEQIRDTESDHLIPDVKTIGPDLPKDKLGWEEKLEQLGPSEMEMFTRVFAQELGRRVAEIIAAKIDPDKLIRLIKAEIVERRNKSR